MTSTDPHHSPDGLDNPDVAHEESDVDVRTILAFAVGLVAMVAVSFVLMWVLFRVLERQAARTDPQVSPLARPTCPYADIQQCADLLPAGPQLQTNEPEGLAKFRASEARSLESYGWVTVPGGAAHMPIDEAKKLILQRGLPVRADPAGDPRTGTNAYAMGESSGGRTIGAPAPAPAAGTAPPPPAAAAPEPPGGAHK
jgi:hypothetical protein